MDDERSPVRGRRRRGGRGSRSTTRESDGIWIKFAKKASGIPTVAYAEAVEVALTYGWIDGQAKRIDDDWYRQRFTPAAPARCGRRSTARRPRR